MQWNLKASEKIGSGDMTRGEWVEKLQESGQDTSSILEEPPELFPDLVEYWSAFHVLSSSRSSGFSIGYIPLPALESYFRIMNIDSLEERLEYIHFVGVLDSEYLKWQGEQHEKKQKQKPASSPKGRTTKALPPGR